MIILRVTSVVAALTALLFASCTPKNSPTNAAEYPVYKGDYQEVTYTKQKSIFMLWAPSAQDVELRIYSAGDGGEPKEVINMKRAKQGTWRRSLKGDYRDLFYTFRIKHNGEWLAETPGIWAKAVGVNGDRGAIIEWAETNPQGWAEDKRPQLKNFTDITIYEMHHRDLSISPSSGSANRGKYLALTETGTRSVEGLSTGLDHIKELGVTHVHLLPSYDYASVDERRAEDNEYNWGYDPKNYNAVEGSYSTDPYNPTTRIREFKQMVQALHTNGIRVIMDVVYNHTFANDDSNFSLTAPGYFYRMDESGDYSNASGCGNETASEREMMRKYIVESVKFWATEYHIDGFRFDLMGIHDIETMNLVRQELDKIDPTIFIYGEGWSAGGSPLPEEKLATKKNGLQMPRIALFSDDIRDALRGSWSESSVPGFASGQHGFEESVKFGVVGATAHPQIDFTKVKYSKAAYANNPDEVINYVSCHDDLSLVDKLTDSAPKGANEEELMRFNKLAQTVVFTSQGVPFIYAGEEIYRNKQGVHNSYKSPDSINQIDWSFKALNSSIFNYYKGLISLRKAHPAFRMVTASDVAQNLSFLDVKGPNMVAYSLNGDAVGDSWSEIIVILNANRTASQITIPAGKWSVACRDGEIFNDTSTISNSVASAKMSLQGGSITIEPSSAMILYK